MSKNLLLLAVFNSAYLLFFGVRFVLSGNYEFLGYIAQIVLIGGLVAFTLQKTRFPFWLLALLSLWGLGHLAGGGLRVGEGVLYVYRIFYVWSSGADYVLKYDQFLHFYGFFVSTLICFWILLPQVRPGARIAVVAGVASLGGMGLGAVNEIVEFIAYALLPATGVGGYVNTALDLVANGLGAIFAAVCIVFLYTRSSLFSVSVNPPGKVN